MEVDFSKFKIKWPKSYYKGIEIEKLVNFHHSMNREYPPTRPTIISKNILQLIFAICEKMKYSNETKTSILNLFSNIYKKDPKSVEEDSLLFVLVSLLIVSKIFEKDYTTFDVIHNLTNHSYTNPQIISVESLIISEFGFDMLNNDGEVFSYNYLYYIYLIKPIFPADKFPCLIRVCEIIHDILAIEYDKFKISITEDLFALALIQSATTILTQHSGCYPFIWKLQSFCYYDENTILKISKKMLKIVLGNEFYADLSI